MTDTEYQHAPECTDNWGHTSNCPLCTLHISATA